MKLIWIGIFLNMAWAQQGPSTTEAFVALPKDPALHTTNPVRQFQTSVHLLEQTNPTSQNQPSPAPKAQ